MSIIVRCCPTCGEDMLAGDPDPALLLLVTDAAVDTIARAGFTPERASDFVECLTRWCELIRTSAPRLQRLSDRELRVLLRTFVNTAREQSTAVAAE
jgi:hypothetical protein